MIESKSLTVPPSLENSTIDLWQNFGWTLKSTQEVNTKEYVVEERSDGYYNVPVGENYVKLAFQRDTSIPNYARIKELEGNYAEILNSEPTEIPAIFSLKTHLIIGGILCLFYVVPGVIYFIIYFKKKKENTNWYEKKYAEWSEKMNTEGKQILDEVTSLLA